MYFLYFLVIFRHVDGFEYILSESVTIIRERCGRVTSKPGNVRAADRHGTANRLVFCSNSGKHPWRSLGQRDDYNNRQNRGEAPLILHFDGACTNNL
jgi:hypothetical protein